MQLVVTGGGTGGHVFPALEVARTALDAGVEVRYFGSFRGQEQSASQKLGIAFVGFASEPVYSLKTPAGWKALTQLIRCTFKAKAALKAKRPDVVFSTGGYASAPVVRAAQMLGIPYVLHEQNSVPGRSNLLAAKRAYCVATTFHSAEKHFEGCKVERTGLPVRRELRERSADKRLFEAEPRIILAVGGSQGAARLNETVLSTAPRMEKDLRWIHVTGRKHFESLFSSYEKMGIASIYRMKSFLEGEAMAEAYSEATLVVGRSGAGTLSELAAFGLPSVLIPYPYAHANHQYENAKEFEGIGAATIIQEEDLHPARLEENLDRWLESASAFSSARESLAAWDCPHAADRILELLRSSVTFNK